MSEIKPFQNAKKLIIWLISRLKVYENRIFELKKFIQELENINYSIVHQTDQTFPPQEVVSAVKKVIYLKSYDDQLGGLGTKNILDFESYTSIKKDVQKSDLALLLIEEGKKDE